MSKVNILEGNWCDISYCSLVRPILQQNNVPVMRHVALPLTDMHSASFWKTIQDKPSIASLDYRHWLYDNKTFITYVNKISRIPFQAVCMTESPFGFEFPEKMEMRYFANLLADRTKIFANIIKSRQPSTKIMAPAIRVTTPVIQNMMLKYLLHNRSLFDVYTVHCCCEISERSLGTLSGYLNEALRILSKPVWITKWASPSCDHPITSTKIIVPTEWTPVSHQIAASKLKTVFNTINEVAGGNAMWLYIGSGKDMYNPDYDVPTWSFDTVYQPDFVKNTWEDYHFLGLIDYQGNVKSLVLQSLIGMANAN